MSKPVPPISAAVPRDRLADVPLTDRGAQAHGETIPNRTPADLEAALTARLADIDRSIASLNTARATLQAELDRVRGKAEG